MPVMVLALWIPACLFSVVAGSQPCKNASKPAAGKRRLSLGARSHGVSPDDDHFGHEAIEHADHICGGPEDKLEKDFISLDTSGDYKLDVQELMFRQYETGCEPSVAQARAIDYMRCGDKNKDNLISIWEFRESVKPAWAACVKRVADRRVHGFVRFFDADDDFDGKLTATELKVGIMEMWGKAGEGLATPLLKCADKDKDNTMSQDEFHDSIAAYNPATRSWVMWEGTSDPAIIKCLKPAFKAFDAALVFHAVDRNGDNKISLQECYNMLHGIHPSMPQNRADEIFEASDLNKDGFLNLEEFTKAGESYKGKGESFFLEGRAPAAMNLTGQVGVGSSCHAQKVDDWNLYEEELETMKVNATHISADPKSQ